MDAEQVWMEVAAIYKGSRHAWRGMVFAVARGEELW